MSNQMSGSSYVQALATQQPVYDNQLKKKRPKRKKKKGDRD